jgi:hypothetical protein
MQRQLRRQGQLGDQNVKLQNGGEMSVDNNHE